MLLKRSTIKALAITFIFSLIIAFIGFFENIKNGLGINIIALVEVETTTLILFLSMLPIIFIHKLVHSKIKYLFYFVLSLTFSSHLFFTLFHVPSSFTRAVTSLFIHTSAMSIFLLINYYFFKKYAIKSLFYFMIIIALFYQIYISISIGDDLKDSLNYRQNQIKIDIATGELKESIYDYNLIQKAIDNNISQKKLKKLIHLKIKLDIETISQNSVLLEGLIENGYCLEWTRLKENNNSLFKDSTIIDDKCSNLQISLDNQ